jgi:hypothetical protein
MERCQPLEGKRADQDLDFAGFRQVSDIAGLYGNERGFCSLFEMELSLEGGSVG